MRATSSTDPALASILARLSRAASRCRPQKDIERQVAPAVPRLRGGKLHNRGRSAPPDVRHRIVGGVEIEHDFARRRLVGLEEQGDEQALDDRRVMADPVVARGGARRGMLQPVDPSSTVNRGW
jgi:hypothetical protein